jgi:hypothetical protein
MEKKGKEKKINKLFPVDHNISLLQQLNNPQEKSPVL